MKNFIDFLSEESGEVTAQYNYFVFAGLLTAFITSAFSSYSSKLAEIFARAIVQLPQ